ncbi:hypothetical protein HELRODRAFT_184156 [Helobdella robusta]|uniref:Uncharacterized protein n=1 Tax=Helobdella robusta TaxID=6412 RepID=T1FKP3_HELRO|nr:hypothetical protein HELRODRAFT_184156 [Helobdella robusta]ESO07064.1 hypothetical protein HELRODRAFT_184156 [Helobdella robusta]
MDSAKNMAYRQLSSVVNPSISTNFEPPTIINGSQFNRTTLSDNFQKQEQFFERIATLSTSEQKSYGYSVSDLINYCTYMGERCDLSNDFESFYNPLHGNCYVYNSGWNDSKQIVTATREGPKNGLEMVVNIDQMDYVKQAGSLAGIRVVILDQNQMPFPEDEGVSVGPGQLTYISLQRHEINRLGSPYGSCTEQLFDPFTSAYSAFYNVQYRAKGCEYTCYQKKIMHECGCIDFSYLNITALMENINADNMSLCQSGNFEQG